MPLASGYLFQSILSYSFGVGENSKGLRYQFGYWLEFALYNGSNTIYTRVGIALNSNQSCLFLIFAGRPFKRMHHRHPIRSVLLDWQAYLSGKACDQKIFELNFFDIK